jgi:hypothetical protein
MAKIESKFASVGDKKNDCLLRREKNDERFFFQGIFRVGVCALHTLGRHVANVPKVGCHVVNELGQF